MEDPFSARKLLGKKIIAVRHSLFGESDVTGIELEGGIKISSVDLTVSDRWSNSVGDEDVEKRLE